MKYAYEDLGPKQFELLTVFLCQRLLGVSVQSFATGPDGGRDAKFVGTAELHPSKAAPWVGTVVIQAKHTNGYNKNFFDSEFFSQSAANTIIAKEIPRIRNLRQKKELDHYMLFANRRLAGNAESIISSYISRECDIPLGSVYLAGTEQLDILLKTFPGVPELAGIDPIDGPLIVSPDEMAEVVEALSKATRPLGLAWDKPPTPRVSFEKKNTINNTSEAYAEAQRKLYLKDTSEIRIFLAMPENKALRQCYEIASEEFQLNIIAKRKQYQNFDEVMEYLVRLLFDRDAILRRNKRLTRALLFYMYWNCDIGEDRSVETEQTLAS